jgi:hypothetical protein
MGRIGGFKTRAINVDVEEANRLREQRESFVEVVNEQKRQGRIEQQKEQYLGFER